jgi:hypothetical protein
MIIVHDDHPPLLGFEQPVDGLVQRRSGMDRRDIAQHHLAHRRRCARRELQWFGWALAQPFDHRLEQVRAVYGATGRSL